MKAIMFDAARVNGAPQLITSPDLNSASDLPAAITRDGYVASCWEFTDEERRAIAAGANLFLFQRTGGRSYQPISLVIEGVQ